MVSTLSTVVSIVRSNERSRSGRVRVRKRVFERVTAGLEAYVKVLNSSSERRCLRLQKQGMEREMEPTVYLKVRRAPDTCAADA